MAAFLKNLFTPKWQHSDANIRLAAIGTDTDMQVLNQLASEDSNTEVRLKAISHLKAAQDLTNLLADKNTQIKNAATEQFLFIALGSKDRQAQVSKVKEIHDTDLLMRIATLATEKELSQTALSSINDEQTLLEFIQQSASAKARQLAIDKIHKPELLKAIEKQFKSKDKTLTRLAKTKLALIHNSELENQKALEHTRTLLEQAKQLAKANFKPTYLAELTHLKQAWPKANGTDIQGTEFSQAIELCENTLAQNQQIQSDLEAKQKDIQAAQQAHKECLDELHVLFNDCKSGNIPVEDVLAEALQKTMQKWSQANQLNAAGSVSKNEYDTFLKPLSNLQSSLNTLKNIQAQPEKETDDFQQLLKQLKTAETHIKKINWPKDFPAGKQLHVLESILESKLKEVETHKSNEKKTKEIIGKTLEQVEKSINEGQIKSAKQMQSKVRKLIKQLPTQKDKSLSNRFLQLSNQLNELNDWQGYAAAPKLEALCAEMESLINTQADAKQLAHKIHDLQEQWKSLGGLPDKQMHNQLWQRFKTAADTAYEPCKQYYQDLAKLKQYNQVQKEEICQQLENFFENNDWPNADMKATQVLLEQANNEFKKFSPVDNRIHKSLQNRFHQSCKQINSKVTDFYQENAQQKQQIIDQCQALLEQEELNSAIEQCKKLQQDWKQVGPAGRQENTLWKRFRENCDSLFNRRSEQHAAHKQHLSDEKNKAQAILEQAQTWVEQASNESLSQLKSLKHAVLELELPLSIQEQKVSQLAKYEEQIKQKQKQAAQQAQVQLWLSAMDISMQLAKWELNQEGDKDGLQATITQTPLPKEVAEIFNVRLQDAKPNNNDDYLKHCLELEIIQQIESPAADQAARMAMQVKRLQQNMGKKVPEPEQQLQSLQLSWFGLAATTGEYHEYTQRFEKALKLVK